MGKTRSACPACKEAGEWRDSNDVCKACRQLIEEGKMRRKEIAEIPETVVVRLPWEVHGLPYISHSFRDREPGREVQKAFFELLRLVSTPAPDDKTWTIGGFIEGQQSGCDREDCVRVNVEIRRVLNLIYAGIVEVAEVAYLSGRRDGGNLLVRIAEGDLSISEINKATIEAG